jgi:galactitol-specific phosphotransferase system IIB component
MKIETFVEIEQIKKDLEFTSVGIDKAFMEQAAMFSYYAFARRQAERQEEKLKHASKIMSSRIDKALRTKCREEKIKMSEPQIASEIESDPRMIELHKNYLDARQIANLLGDTVEAFRHRRDMLIQFGADSRQERAGELRMSEISGDLDSRKQAVMNQLSKKV